MPLEIERKFLVISDAYRNKSQALDITQAYLAITLKIAIRVRIEGIQASLAIKSKVSERINKEYEYSIPLDEARLLMNMSEFLVINKTRHIVEYKEKTWEIDEFHNQNLGLVVAEIELDDENEEFQLPPWIGGEVTSDYRYLNSNLAKNPFSDW